MNSIDKSSKTTTNEESQSSNEGRGKTQSSITIEKRATEPIQANEEDGNDSDTEPLEIDGGEDAHRESSIPTTDNSPTSLFLFVSLSACIVSFSVCKPTGQQTTIWRRREQFETSKEEHKGGSERAVLSVFDERTGVSFSESASG